MEGDFQRTVAFILECDRLKNVLRKTKPTGLNRYENSAEHSWQISLLAMLLAREAIPQVDVRRVIEMLLVHDIPEIDAGDTFVYSRGPDTSAAERKGAERIFGLLPEAEATHCLALWEEFEAQATPEAKFARAVDRLMPMLQNLHNEGQSWREHKVSVDQVLAVNAVIAAALPGVWADMRSRLAAASADGLFGTDPTT